MNVQELIQTLQALENKELLVVTYDGMDNRVVTDLIVGTSYYWTGDDFGTGVTVTIK